MTFIIAEVGSNWKTEDDLFSSILDARRCGADAVKFQLFSHYDLYGEPSTNWPGNEYALRASLIPNLKKACDDVGIEFMCTVFNHELVPTLDSYVNYHKVSSSNMMDLLLLKALQKTGKTVFLSTGGWNLNQIRVAMSHFSPDQAIPMYCQPDYPAVSPDLRCISLLREEFGVGGFSDHTLDHSFLGWSAANDYCADVIEKHVNFTRHDDTPDSTHALGLNKFKQYVLNIKDCYEPCMPTRFHDMQLYHYARPVVLQDCLPGEEIKYRYCRVYNADMHREYGEDLEGSKARVPLKKGSVLKLEHIQ
ncbi:MAG: N-acetylneuraminate synthase family protein [Candidatus Thorarchaeota archaeon]|jgi:N-acetylneuraminate synthase